MQRSKALLISLSICVVFVIHVQMATTIVPFFWTLFTSSTEWLETSIVISAIMAPVIYNFLRTFKP